MSNNHLTALAADIQATLRRQTVNREEWIEIHLDLCRLLAEARSVFGMDAEFGQWLEANGLGSIGKNDRAAYIAMGVNIDRARTVLTATKRRSIQLIYEHEFREVFPNARKVKQAQRSVNTTDEAWNAFKAQAEESGKPVAAVLGEMIEKAIDPDLPPAETMLSLSAVARLELYQRKLDRTFEERVQVEARKLHMEWYEESVKQWSERLKKFERQLGSRPGVVTAGEYKTLLQCCHPDTGASVSDAKRNEATRILTEHRLKLMTEKEDPFLSKHGLPRTMEEMQRAREAVRAENSARARAAHAARKAH